MDAQENEQDVQLQKSSAQLLSDFDASLVPLLWRRSKDGSLRIRHRVKYPQFILLLNMIEPFQELPQLLDPHLSKFIPILADALLQYLREQPVSDKRSNYGGLLMSTPSTVCRLLYTFCKIRGEKIIVRFFGAEAKNLELLLSAVTEANSQNGKWAWEETYVILLWLSHLMLAPFDLSTISSSELSSFEANSIWPGNLPSVAARVIKIATKYIESSGKQRESAKALLVRISMRKDMQEIGLTDAAMRWALSALHPSNMVDDVSIYHHIGVLSFLAGILNSSMDTSDMDRYLSKIFHTVRKVSDSDEPAFKRINSSAVARKTIIKVLRTVSVLILRSSSSHFHSAEDGLSEVVETTISYLLECLADNDTPVRLAASKALSVITLKLPTEMAAQVIEAILDSLNHNVLIIESPGKKSTRDLNAVNPLEWHGLVLTLSQLLYRRSSPPETLAYILRALLLGLSFEKRSSSGTSIGANVRDAACFGIWALARRYSTDELLSVTAGSATDTNYGEKISVLQLLAMELVVTASLDPEGNIRRGASAALQELIGRHPDSVVQGIPLVQAVDYHAVALRSRAVKDVAADAAKLSELYYNALIDGMLGWRGIGDPSTSSRRMVAEGMEDLLTYQFRESPLESSLEVIKRMVTQYEGLKGRDSDERHGLFLCTKAAIKSLCGSSGQTGRELDRLTLVAALEIVSTMLKSSLSSVRRPELAMEGANRLLGAACGLLRPAAQLRVWRQSQEKQISLLPGLLPQVRGLLEIGQDLLNESLQRSEEDVIVAATDAASSMLPEINIDQRTILINHWNSATLSIQSGRAGQALGFLRVIGAVFESASIEQQTEICNTLERRWSLSPDIESRVVILQCVRNEKLLESYPSVMAKIIGAGLNEYISDARGDIGSLVRMEAAKTVSSMINFMIAKDANDPLSLRYHSVEIEELYQNILRLSAEKLDRVRNEAQKTLTRYCTNEEHRLRFENLSCSTYDYFKSLLDFQIFDDCEYVQSRPLLPTSRWISLFEGYVTSSDAGSEDLVRASRAALVQLCELDKVINLTELNAYNCVDLVCNVLFEVAKKNLENDRILVSALEILGFLFDMGITQRSNLEWNKLYLLIQKAHYKTGNVRKLEACVKLYGGLIQVYPQALKKLTSILLHPFPKIRNQVADTLFILYGVARGTNWVKAGKADLAKLQLELHIV